VERGERVHHGGHGDEREEAGADAADAVAEVEQADGEAAEDDGEVEPAQEGALVGEEDLGLNARRQGNALAFLKDSGKTQKYLALKINEVEGDKREGKRRALFRRKHWGREETEKTKRKA
jgi:hypothetical protein